MENHQHHPGHKMKPENKIKHREMNHSSMHHDENPSMGMEGHDHHVMMISDFKKRFWVSLITYTHFFTHDTGFLWL